MPAVEHEVAHVDDVGALERDGDVAAGVRAAVELAADPLVAQLLPPGVRERAIRVELFGWRRRARPARLRGDLLLQFDRTLVREHALCDPLERDVALRVIGVMVRVDQQIHAVVLRTLLQSVKTGFRRIRELAVDYNHGAFVDEIANRPAAAHVETHVAPDWRERRRPRGRRLLRRWRGRLLSLLHRAGNGGLAE